VWVYDHFHTTPEPSQEATHEAWTLMAAFAASTSRVRLGQMCTCMAYRNPAYLAKVAATADVISGGRVEMGIGAGWYEHEWRAYGYGFPSAGERIAMLDEGVQIFRSLWSTGKATFQGAHYQVDGAQLAPLPLQKDGPPLWIAGGGEKKTLRVAAQHAAYTNFDGTPEGFAHKSEVLRGHCAAVGRDFGDIVRSANYNVVIGRTEAEVEDRFAWIEEHLRASVPAKADSTLADLRNGPLVGTPEQVVETLTGLQELGMTYAITYFAEAAYDRSGIELFESEVVPALRG
jgi:F420-dependent oxidoreductase-like protein